MGTSYEILKKKEMKKRKHGDIEFHALMVKPKKLIDSYLSAINDKDNEIVHLYEIRELRSKKLGGNEKARKSLSIPKTIGIY